MPSTRPKSWTPCAARPRRVAKRSPHNHAVRGRLATSLALPAEEVKARIDRGDQWVIRFKMPVDEVVKMDDLIRGHVEVNTSTLDDKVL